MTMSTVCLGLSGLSNTNKYMNINIATTKIGIRFLEFLRSVRLCHWNLSRIALEIARRLCHLWGPEGWASRPFWAPRGLSRKCIDCHGVPINVHVVRSLRDLHEQFLIRFIIGEPLATRCIIVVLSTSCNAR